MRTLKFIVEGQIIKQDPSCDFSNLVPGTKDIFRQSSLSQMNGNDVIGNLVYERGKELGYW